MDGVDALYQKIVHKIYQLQFAILRMRGASIHKSATAYGRFFIVGPAKNLTIKSGVTLNQGVLINLFSPVFIDEECRLSAYSQIQTASLEMNSERTRLHQSAPVVLGKNVWICAGSIVCKNVTIGENSVVAANSVLTDSISANMFAGGTPARIIKELKLSDVE